MRRKLRLDRTTIRILTDLRPVAGGQEVSSTGGDPRTCCWPDPPLR